LYVIERNDDGEETALKTKQAENVAFLKQKIIYLQSELARYQAKHGDWGALQAECEHLKEALAQAEATIKELTKKLEETAAENILLKELALLSEQRYEELMNVKKQKEELERQLAQRQAHAPDDGDESWFYHTLRQQNAIVKNERQASSFSPASPFSFAEEADEK
jgi:predicted nuclease with TOPRIM domain